MRSLAVALLLAVGTAAAVAAPTEFSYELAPGASAHRVGRLNMAVTVFGTQFESQVQGPDVDMFSGRPLSGEQFPVGQGSYYLVHAGIVVGNFVDSDTALSGTVSPDHYSSDFQGIHSPLAYRSTVDPDPLKRADAVSEYDLLVTLSDTVLLDDWWNFTPIGIELDQRTFSWSLPNVRDIVFAKYTLRNIQPYRLDTFTLGMYLSEVVGTVRFSTYEEFPDICGIRRVSRNDASVNPDSLDMIWLADNDGNSLSRFRPDTALMCMTGALGFVTLDAPLDQPMRMNWYTYGGGVDNDVVGPTHVTDAFVMPDTGRMLNTTGRHAWLLAYAEPDMDFLYYHKLAAESPDWLTPTLPYDSMMSPEVFASYGPASVGIGDSLVWVAAFVGGEPFHTNATNYQRNIINTYDPDAFYAELDFSDLDKKARIAAKVYDNPGVDSDGDGYAGQFVVENGDTIWTSGDGIPDWKPALAPAAPGNVRVEYSGDSAIVRFNGLEAETRPDRICEENLFEGYRAYQGRDSGSLTPVGYFDEQNFVAYMYDPGGGWFVHYEILSLDQIRCRYGDGCDDTTFQPLSYTPSSPLMLYNPNGADSLLYFDRYGYNAPLTDRGLHKRYPQQAYPTSLDPNAAQPEELTEEGFLKYFEYEYVVTNLAPDDTVWIDIRSFGSGPAARFASAIESRSTVTMLADPEGCCVGMRGNLDAGPDDPPDGTDLAVLVDLLYNAGVEPACRSELDVNGDGLAPDVLDLAYLIDFVYYGGAAPAACP